MLRRLCFSLLFVSPVVSAADMGVHGALFPIKEESLLDHILMRLSQVQQSGKLEELQGKFLDQVKKSILYPKTDVELSRATMPRKKLYDPTLTVSEDITDHESRVIAKKGFKVNPLDYVSWGEPLVMINGEDKEQVIWALSQQGKITLTKGSAINLEEEAERPIYFDQGGLVVKKFDIKALPARISQEGSFLKVEEIVLKAGGQ